MSTTFPRPSGRTLENKDLATPVEHSNWSEWRRLIDPFGSVGNFQFLVSLAASGKKFLKLIMPTNWGWVDNKILFFCLFSDILFGHTSLGIVLVSFHALLVKWHKYFKGLQNFYVSNSNFKIIICNMSNHRHLKK